jgi:outer membrane lipoprotein carrier protein
MKRSANFFLLLFIFILGPYYAASAINSEQTIVNAIQKNYQSVRTFQAEFEQKSFVNMINRTEIAQGNVQIKKPGKMKWVYNDPDPQVLISNQKNLWLYSLEDKQATKMPVESVYSSNTPALFLAGEGILTNIFNVTEVITGKNIYTVTLSPKEAKSDLNRLILRANKNNYQIIGVTVYDDLGNKTQIKFKNIRINEQIAESIFDFKVPAGVEIQDFTPNP